MRALLVALLIALPSASEAKPLLTSAETLETESRVVFVGLYGGLSQDGRHVLTVERSLRGDLKPGTVLHASHLEVQTPRGLKPGERLVFFLDGDQRLRWIARPRSAPLESSILDLEGFYDFNAHLVEPPVLSLALLERILTGGELHIDIEGALVFPSDPETPTEHTFSLRMNLAGEVLSFDSHDDLPAPVHARLPTWRDGDLRWLFQGGLILVGELDGVNLETGALQARLWPETPTVLRRADWLRYVASPETPPRYRVHVEEAGWQLVFGGDEIGALLRPEHEPAMLTAVVFANSSGHRSQSATSPHGSSAVSITDRRIIATVGPGQHVHLILDGPPPTGALQPAPLSGLLLQTLMRDDLPCHIEYEGMEGQDPPEGCALSLVGPVMP